MRSGRVREAHPEVREGSGGPPEGLGGVESHTQRSVGVGRPTWRSRRGREAHPEVQDAHL